MLCGCFSTKNTLAPLHMVEVERENFLFAQESFQSDGDDPLLALSQQGALATQEQILGQLLGNG